MLFSYPSRKTQWYEFCFADQRAGVQPRPIPPPSQGTPRIPEGERKCYVEVIFNTGDTRRPHAASRSVGTSVEPSTPDRSAPPAKCGKHTSGSGSGRCRGGPIHGWAYGNSYLGWGIISRMMYVSPTMLK